MLLKGAGYEREEQEASELLPGFSYFSGFKGLLDSASSGLEEHLGDVWEQNLDSGSFSVGSSEKQETRRGFFFLALKTFAMCVQ